jgi:hypothetical protein
MKDFNEILASCISTSLAGVLGVPLRDAIYLDLLTRFSVAQEQVPTCVEILLRVLEENFGQAATKAISKDIAKRLHSELHIDFANHPDFDLERYVDEAKRIALERSRQESGPSEPRME